MNSVAVKKVLVIGIFFIAYVLWQAIGTLSEYYPIYNYPPLHKGPIILFGDALAATSSIGFVGILEKRLDLQIEIESSARIFAKTAMSMCWSRSSQMLSGTSST